jgi:hypothetical protein
MASEVLKEVYETPLAVVRGVFLCENLMVCPSPVTRVTLEDWSAEETPVSAVAEVDLFFPLM